MQAGLMAIVKTCDMVWRELSKGYAFDLEDFNADKSEVSLLESVQVPTVIRQLDKALAWLDRWQTPNREWQKALYHRIALRKHILLAVSVNESVVIEPFKRSTYVSDALASYHSVRAGPVPATLPPSSQLHASFDPTINRRLIVNMPLKVIELMPISDAWKSLQSMLEGRIRALHHWPLDRPPLPVHPAHMEDTIERHIMQHLMSLCYNRPRMRRSMSKTLASWHQIWEDTIDVAVAVREDESLKDLKRLPLGIRHLRLSNVVDLIFAGFETNLCAQAEWPLMYWHLTRILGLQVQTMELLSRLLREDTASHSSSELYARSHIIYSKALRSLCHATLLALFIRPPKDLNVSKLSQPPTPDECLLIQRRFKWAFGSHTKRIRYEDDARPDLSAWTQFAAKIESREATEVVRETLKEFKEARVHLLNLVDQSVWKTAGGACDQLMNEFLTGCIRVCSAQISALEAVAESDDPGAGTEELNHWTFEHSLWFPTISRLMSNA
ncbi:hypothetical protein FRC12_013772 [Ceratobasidium sp. 428]|nr:hypothetical protein FRC12_013772 [Ceratobasidium sp. 428]